MNPNQAFANRTARLLAEGAHKPRVAYTSEARPEIQPEIRPSVLLLAQAEQLTGPDFCFVCSRSTDHFGEHTDEQLLAFANSPLGQTLVGLGE